MFSYILKWTSVHFYMIQLLMQIHFIIFYFEIYVCLFSNLIWKKVISILVKSWSDCNNFILFRKKLSRNFIKLTWDPAEKLVKCLNSAIFIEFFDYIFLKFTKCDYKTFLRFYSDNKEKKKNECVLRVILKVKSRKSFSIIVDIFISKKKKLVHFVFDEPLVSSNFFHDIIGLVSLLWEEILQSDLSKIQYIREIKKWLYFFFKEKKCNKKVKY